MKWRGCCERSGVGYVRRTALSPGRFCEAPSNGPCPIILLDTIGELGAAWGLADIAFVGGSLDGVRGGQNMIEPAAYGAAVLFGPHTWNFKDTVAKLKAASAAIEVGDAAALEEEVLQMLADAPRRHRLGEAARRLVAQQQGATEKTIRLLSALVTNNVPSADAA